MTSTTSRPPPDRVVTKPILLGLCGSDAKLLLGDLDGATSTTRWPPSSLPPVPGHEVVASDPGPTGPGGRRLRARAQIAELRVTPFGGARPGRVRLDRPPDR